MGQPVFNNVYDHNNTFDGFQALYECNNGDYVVGGQALNILTNETNSFIVRVDNKGNLIWKNLLNLRDKSSDFISDIHEMQSGQFFIVGVYRDSLLDNRFNSYTLKLNENGDSLNGYLLQDTLVNSTSKVIFINNKYYVLQWMQDNVDSLKFYSRVLVMDTLGIILDKWNYDMGYDIYQDFKLVDDDFLLAGYTKLDSSGINRDFKFVRIDSAGVVIWESVIGLPRDEFTRNHNYLTLTKDNGYVICGQEDLPLSTITQGVILKVDSLGNQLWRKGVNNGEYTTSTSIREWSDGSLVALSNFTNYDTIIPLFNDPRGHLLKLSADGFQVIWERTFSKWWLDETINPNGLFSHDYVRDMILSSDGGIVVSGYQIHPAATRNDGWIVKFDSCGYTVGAEPHAEFTIDSIVGPQIYITNLSEDYCIGSMGISVYNPLSGDTLQVDSLHVYAYSEYTSGTKPTQFVYTLPDTGTYFFSLHTYAGDGEDLFSTSIQVSDISTGITHTSTIDFQIYPNPTDDYLIVQGGASLQEIEGEIQMKIYSTTGQLIKVYSLNSQLYQERIFLGELSNGVYLLQFTIDGQVLGNERLSVVR